MLRQLPHLITLTRLAASPALVWLLIQSRFREALALAFFAGLTDWFDGFTARRLRVERGVGVVLDPIADKTMLVSLFVALAYVGLIPKWLLALVIGRDIIIVLGALLLRLYRGIREFLPSVLGKISTFFQIGLVLLVMLRASLQADGLLRLENIAIILVALFAAASGVDYVARGVRMASRKSVRAS